MVEVRYKEITEEGLLRQPTFLRFRSDKTPAECVAADAPPEPASVEKREVPFSNLDKVFWPEEGYTKGDLIEYYRSISPWLLPYLKDRPVVLTRYPDGIAGKSFFQKDAPDYVPSWIRTARVYSDDGGRDIDFFICEDVETLLYVINLGFRNRRTPTGASSISIPRRRPSRTWSRWRARCTNSARRSDCRVFAKRAGRKVCTCSCRSPDS